MRHAHGSSIGGGGERKTFRLVARYADACNLFASAPTEVAHKLEVLARHCEDDGRDPATIRTTILAMGNPLDDADGFVAQMADYAEIGVDLVEVMPVGDPIEFTESLGTHIIPAVAQLGR